MNQMKVGRRAEDCDRILVAQSIHDSARKTKIVNLVLLICSKIKGQ